MRYQMKGLCVLLALCLLPTSLATCSGNRGQVDAEATAGLLEPVIKRHQAYVEQDPALSDVQRSTYLRSGELAQSVLDEARRKPAEEKAAGKPQDTPAAD